MILLLFFAFVSGLVTIAAPCIWPLLPIVLSSSSLGGHRRPLGLTFGILLSFGVITLSISYLVHLFGFDASLLRTIAVVVLVAFGAMLIFPKLSEAVEAFVSRATSGVSWAKSGTGFWPGFLSGLPLGVVWAPCAGPILASIAALSATRDVGVAIILVTIAYLAGIGIPLFIFSYAGQRFVRTTRAFSKYTGALQRVFGAAIVVTAGLIFFNLDTRLEADLLATVPSYSSFLNKLEGNAAVTQQLDKIKGIDPLADLRAQAASKTSIFNANSPAPDFKGIERWLNLPAGQSALSLEQYRGKVVLIDFWTYTCINCIRALPHVLGWYNQYHTAGLEVVGVHTPEFQFEHETSNVQAAIQRFNIPYPVGQDNDYATWKAYRNQYWPAEYLIDKDGNVRLVEFGEGKSKYDKTEQAIRELLAQTGAAVPAGLTATPDQTPKTLQSPETYLGADTMRDYFPVGNIGKGPHLGLKTVPNLSINSFVFGGDWDVEDDYSESGQNAVVEHNFHAEHVYVVAHAPMAGGPGTMRVLLDGKPVDAPVAGADVNDGSVTVDTDRLYDLIVTKDGSASHILRLELSPGIQLYTFDFG